MSECARRVYSSNTTTYRIQKYLEERAQSLLCTLYNRDMVIVINDNTGNFHIIRDMDSTALPTESFFKTICVTDRTGTNFFVLASVVHPTTLYSSIIPVLTSQPIRILGEGGLISCSPGQVPAATTTTTSATSEMKPFVISYDESID